MPAIYLSMVLALAAQTQAPPEPPRLDASSEAALEASILRMLESLPPSDGWNAHPLGLALDSLGNTEGMAERDRASAAQGKKPERVPVLKHLHGMTYPQIIAAWHARELKLREVGRAQMEQAGVKWSKPLENPAFDVRYPTTAPRYPVDPHGPPAPPGFPIPALR